MEDGFTPPTVAQPEREHSGSIAVAEDPRRGILAISSVQNVLQTAHDRLSAVLDPTEEQEMERDALGRIIAQESLQPGDFLVAQQELEQEVERLEEQGQKRKKTGELSVVGEGSQSRKLLENALLKLQDANEELGAPVESKRKNSEPLQSNPKLAELLDEIRRQSLKDQEKITRELEQITSSRSTTGELSPQPSLDAAIAEAVHHVESQTEPDHTDAFPAVSDNEIGVIPGESAVITDVLQEEFLLSVEDREVEEELRNISWTQELPETKLIRNRLQEEDKPDYETGVLEVEDPEKMREYQKRKFESFDALRKSEIAKALPKVTRELPKITEPLSFPELANTTDELQPVAVEEPVQSRTSTEPLSQEANQVLENVRIEHPQPLSRDTEPLAAADVVSVTTESENPQEKLVLKLPEVQFADTPEESLANFEAALWKNPKDGSLYMGKAQSLIVMARHAESIRQPVQANELYQQVLQTCRDGLYMIPRHDMYLYADLYLSQAAALTATGKPKEALKSLDTLAKFQRAETFELYLARADALSQIDTRLSIFEYEKALHLRPGEFRVYVAMAEALKNEERYEEALTSYDNALSLSGRDVSILQLKREFLLELSLSNSAIQEHRAAEQMAEYERALTTAKGQKRQEILAKERDLEIAVGRLQEADALDREITKWYSETHDLNHSQNTQELRLSTWQDADASTLAMEKLPMTMKERASRLYNKFVVNLYKDVVKAWNKVDIPMSEVPPIVAKKIDEIANGIGHSIVNMDAVIAEMKKDPNSTVPEGIFTLMRLLNRVATADLSEEALKSYAKETEISLKQRLHDFVMNALWTERHTSEQQTGQYWQYADGSTSVTEQPTSVIPPEVSISKQQNSLHQTDSLSSLATLPQSYWEYGNNNVDAAVAQSVSTEPSQHLTTAINNEMYVDTQPSMRSIDPEEFVNTQPTVRNIDPEESINTQVSMQLNGNRHIADVADNGTSDLPAIRTFSNREKKYLAQFPASQQETIIKQQLEGYRVTQNIWDTSQFLSYGVGFVGRANESLAVFLEDSDNKDEIEKFQKSYRPAVLAQVDTLRDHIRNETLSPDIESNITLTINVLREANRTQEARELCYEYAVLNLRRALSLSPGNIDAQYAIAEVYASQGNKEKAKDIYKRLWEAHPDEIHFGKDIMDGLYHLGYLEEASSIGEQLLQRTFTTTEEQTTKSDIILIQADSFYKQGNLEQSIDLYDELLNQRPEDQMILRRIARALYKAGDTELAIVNFRKAEQLLLLENNSKLYNSEKELKDERSQFIKDYEKKRTNKDIESILGAEVAGNALFIPHKLPQTEPLRSSDDVVTENLSKEYAPLLQSDRS